jgi:UDP-N-acetylglucosamine:LPS N-acetylglucosamine transferase
MNYIILDIAQELRIPFLLIPTDLDVTLYIQRIKHPTYKQFYIGLSFDDKDILKPIKKNHIAPAHIITLGAPLKTDFFAHQKKDFLKEQYNIPKNKPVIMLLMGSRGSYETEKYTQQLLKIPFPTHLLVCIGKNLKSKEVVQTFAVPEHITLSLIEFTPHIADYMTIADVLISKSGTQSVCEALYKNIPLFIDALTNPLPWEKFNHIFIKKHHFGQLIKKYKQIMPLMTSLIEEPQQLVTYKHNIKKLEKKNFSQELLTLVKKIVANQ